MTANGTTHPTEEATVYVYDLDMFGQVKESPAVFLGNLCEVNDYSYEWRPGQPSHLFKNARM